VDTGIFFPQQKNDDGIIRIGTIRTLTKKYGVEYLIRSFGLLAEEYNNIHLEIVGDGEEKQFLESLALKLNLADKITFHGFINQKTDFQKYIRLLRSFDIFAILSVLNSETFGVAAVEASACGIPVVASNIGGLPEVVENARTGFLVLPESVWETTVALQKLIENKSLRIEMGAEGREKIKKQFDWNLNVSQMLSLYQKTGNLHTQ
jgi:glycosyltransferase involved in cell wall biosynthesis